ncbi:MAG: PEP-CTERM system histidine kinase PrsK [bacterium]|nr:PEP-CTERM system histidine kinase PrsK [bacterium]MDT8367280.1 PEP-CTERM system histidine kinase PrsK [bacterium]
MDFSQNIELYIIFIAALFSAVLALYALVKGPHSISHRFFALGMFLLAAELTVGGMAYHQKNLLDQLMWLRIRNVITALIPGAWFLFALSFGERDFKQRLIKWKWVTLGILLLPLSFPVLLNPSFYEGVSVPAGGGHSVFHLGWPGYLFYLSLIPGFVVLMFVLENTLRFSRGIKRWQIKFLTLGVLGFFAVRIFVSSQAILFRTLNPEMELFLPAGALILANMFIAITLFRSRILPEDIYLSGGFIKRSLVLMVVGTYLVLVGVLTKVLSLLGGPFSYELLGLAVFAALLLLSAILFSDRVKFAVNTFVSRHLSRPKYDYRKTWITFTERTANSRNIRDLAGNTASLLSEMLEILSVNIWLFGEGEATLSLAGSTSLSGSGDLVEMSPGLVASLKKRLAVRESPFDLFDSTDSALRQYTEENEAFLESLGLRYCAPLWLGSDLLGFIALDDRVRGEPMGVEEYDLMGTIAGQAATSIQSLQLSERLQNAREMEALSKFSAFFVHDLKNVASKLSMMLQNFPDHLNSEEFRHDALKLVSQSVDKINVLSRRMAELREMSIVHPEPGSIEPVVNRCLAEMEPPSGVSIEKQYQEVPEIMIDHEQISKVVTNLVLNAIEAVDGNGAIIVRTYRQNGWVVLEVEDDGPGVEEAFLSTSLFGPFKSTKPNGLGIGLYQCRTIVEAHGGRISVKSRPGEGAVFEVYLPVVSAKKGV